MPLPNDEKILALSGEILKRFDALFGLHPGFRPAHAKGAMLTGTFTPTAEAATLSKAPHFVRPSTPITARFSNSTGVPVIPDNDSNAPPRGLGLRFHLADRVHTDIVAHSTNGFPTRTGDEFLEFLDAIAATDQTHFPGSPLEKFLGSHPAALAFVQTPKPAASSFAHESFFALTAMRFTNEAGATRFIRFRILPEEGNDYLEAAAAAEKGPNYLFEELEARIAKQAVKFKLIAQLAEPGDTVDDATRQWGEERPLVEMGKLVLIAPVLDDAHEQKQIIFDPIPRVVGIEPSADPLLELRAAIYLLSGRRRRAAPDA